MNLNKKTLAASALAVAATLAIAVTPAFAAPFDDDQIINGLAIEYQSDSARFGHVYQFIDGDSETSGSSSTHAAGEITFIDSNNTTYGVCVQETAVLTEEADGDVVISCEAVPLSPELEGLTVAPEYRFYNLSTPNMVMTRMLYSISNTTNSDITIPRIETEYNWDNPDSRWNMLTNNGTVTQDTSLTGTSTRWLNTASYSEGVDPSYTTFGAAWRADGNSYFIGYGNDVVSDENITPASENVVIPANSTVMIAFFAVYGSAGVNATPEETTAFMSVLDAQFTVFNEAFTSSSVLAKGIPEGSNVLNWGVVASPPPPPELAVTGSNSSSPFGVFLMAGLLIATGAVLTLRRRA